MTSTAVEPATYEAAARIAADHWWFEVRRGILADLLRPLSLPPGARVLDVGSGAGSTGPVLARFGRTVVGIDAEALPLSLGGPWADAYTARLRAGFPALPFRDASFDLVVALDVLEHVADDQGAAAELRRVLRPGGALVLFVPALQVLWGAHDEVSHHLRRYGRAELRRVAVAAGLHVERVTFFNTLLFPPILLSRLVSRLRRPPAFASDTDRGGPRVQSLLRRVFALERPLLRTFDLPLGVSLALVARR